MQYSIVNDSNVNSWKKSLNGFAKGLDLANRCNSSAVNAGNLDRTYPSVEVIEEFVRKGALVVIAHLGVIVKGYMICTDDVDGKYGGCYCRWVGVEGTPAEQAVILQGMGDVVTEVYEWMWGRVGNETIRNTMITLVPNCELYPGETEIVTYKRP